MARSQRLSHGHPLHAPLEVTAARPGALRRVAARLVALAALAALAAWLGHLAVAPTGHDAAARAAETLLGWLRAAWTP